MPYRVGCMHSPFSGEARSVFEAQKRYPNERTIFNFRLGAVWLSFLVFTAMSVQPFDNHFCIIVKSVKQQSTNRNSRDLLQKVYTNRFIGRAAHQTHPFTHFIKAKRQRSGGCEENTQKKISLVNE